MSHQPSEFASEPHLRNRAASIQRQSGTQDQRRVERQHGRPQTIDFKSIAASISIVTDDAVTAAAGQEGWRYRTTNGAAETLLSFPDVTRAVAGDGHAVAADRDPVVARLSEALAAAERDPSEFSALYADAVRLVTVVRRLSIEGAAGVAREQSPAAGAALPKWRLKLVHDYVTTHLGEKVTLADMAASARLSRMHFAALFLRATGMRPHQYLLRRRIEVAKQLLLETDLPIIQVALQVGFQTQAHFTTVFKKLTGGTPAKWREALTPQTTHQDSFVGTAEPSWASAQ